MTEAEATALCSKLLAAWPHTRGVNELTIDVYVEHLAPLRFDCASESVNDLICEERYFPSVSVVLDTYRRNAQRSDFQAPALPEPDVSEEQKAENIRQAREMVARLTRGMSSD